MEIKAELKFSKLNAAFCGKKPATMPGSHLNHVSMTRNIELALGFLKRQALYLKQKEAYLIRKLKVFKKRSSKRFKYLYAQLSLIRFRLGLLSTLLTTLLLGANSAFALEAIDLLGLANCILLLSVIFGLTLYLLSYLLNQHIHLCLMFWDRLQSNRAALLVYLMERVKGQIWALVYKGITMLIIGPIVFLLGGDLVFCSEEETDINTELLTEIKFSRNAQVMEDLEIDTPEALEERKVSDLRLVGTIKPERKATFLRAYTLGECAQDWNPSGFDPFDLDPMGNIPIGSLDSDPMEQLGSLLEGVDPRLSIGSDPHAMEKLTSMLNQPEPTTNEPAVLASLPLEESFRDMSIDHETAAALQAAEYMGSDPLLDPATGQPGGLDSAAITGHGSDSIDDSERALTAHSDQALNEAGPSNRNIMAIDNLSPFPGVAIVRQLAAALPVKPEELLRRLKTFEEIMQARGGTELNPGALKRAQAYSAELCYRLVKANKTFKQEQGNIFKPWEWNQTKCDNQYSLYYWSMYNKAKQLLDKTDLNGKTVKNGYETDTWFYTFFQRAYYFQKGKNTGFTIPLLEQQLAALGKNPTQAQINLVFRQFVDYAEIYCAPEKALSVRGYIKNFANLHNKNIQKLWAHCFLIYVKSNSQNKKWDYTRKEVPLGYANNPKAPFPRLHEAAMYILKGNFSSESPSQFCKKLYPYFVNLLLEGFSLVKKIDPGHSSIHGMSPSFSWCWWSDHPVKKTGK